MIVIDEVPKMKLFKKQFYLPIEMNNRLKNNVVTLLTPHYDATVRLLNNPLIIKKHYKSYYIEKDIFYIINHEGFIDYNKTNNLINEINLSKPKISNPIISNAKNNSEKNTKKTKKNIRSSMNKIERLSNDKKNNVGTLKDRKNIDKIIGKDKEEDIKESVYVGYNSSEKVYGENKSYIKFNNNDNTNLMYVFEANQIYNSQLRKILYDERIRNNQEVFGIYDMIKEDVPYIKNTYIDIAKYKNKNLIIDTFFYNEIFLNNNVWKREKAIELYFDLIDRFIDNYKLKSNEYKDTETILIPVLEWIDNDRENLDFNKNINFISLIIRILKDKRKINILNRWKGLNFVFMTTKGYFCCDLGTLKNTDYSNFRILLDKLINDDIIKDDNPKKETKKAIMINIIDKLEDDAKIKISKATGDSKEKEVSKAEVIEKIDKAAEISNTSDDTLDKLDEDERLKKILADLQAEEENKVKLSNARVSRMMKAQDKSMDKVIKGRSIRDIMAASKEEYEIPTTELHIDSINDDWKHLTYTNFESSYNIEEDIINIIYSLSEKSEPLAILDIDIQDTSTSEDLKETYTVRMEDAQGQRFTIKFDVPLFVDHKFMKLRGNEKTMNGQLTLIPISKTDESTVQMVSNYKKIFIHTYGTSTGKSYPDADKIYKVLNKFDGKDIKVVPGDNSRICSKYDLPIDYIDLSSVYNTIETSDYIFYFNQDTIRDKYNVDETKGIPIGYDKKNKTVIYYDGELFPAYSSYVLTLLETQSKLFKEISDNTKYANKYMYSKANILNNKIPIIVIMAHSEGLEKSMKKGNVEYTFQEKRPKQTPGYDFIKFNDGYLVYKLDYNSSLLMNGLKECPTENYSITEINNKSMYLDFLDLFGGRILSDGLDNFYDLMIDPITEEVLIKYDLPTDYVELLAYANFLLADNKFIKHTDMSARRYRSNELVAGYVYQSLAESYGNYKTELKKRGSSTMTIKQSTIIDKVMLDPTCADLSSLNDLQNAESINALSYKGLAGLNYDRSYDLDKRGYDESMLNLVAMSTGFAGNVGITRQATIDMNIEGKRGYVKTINNDPEQFSIAKTFGITEALTPFGPTRDDPMRSAMNFIQTSKHGMRTKKSMPLLITSGADMVLPYLTSNTFAFNAKADGKVIEVTPDYMIVEYTGVADDGTKPKRDFIDLRNNIKKNSNGGFYQAIKLDTNMKVGNKFKKNDILAHDKLSYSDIVGNTDDLAYNLGTLCKVAFLTTDEGYQDSAIISEWLSDALSSRVVIKKDYVLPKTTNIYYMVKKGQPIQEGEPLMIFQNAFDDEDVNILLKNLSDDEELISDIGRIPIKSKYTGRIEDIKIYRTV